MRLPAGPLRRINHGLTTVNLLVILPYYTLVPLLRLPLFCLGLVF